MFHHLFIVMSLSGSVVFLVYGLIYPIAQRYLPHFWKKHILCLSLFFYLVPLSLLKQLNEIVLSRLKIDLPFQYKDFHIDPQYTINVESNQSFWGSGVVIVYLFALCVTVIASIIIIIQLRQYSEICRAYSLKTFHETPSPQLERVFQQANSELQIKKPVKFICSKLCNTPMTIGLFKPKIVFPTSSKLNLCLNDNKYILKHELLHIKNRDLFLKFLALLAISIHWYNPICYLLYKELCVVCEMDCDYGVIKGVDDTQRQRYSQLILELASVSNGKKDRFAVGLVNNDAATFERRISEMKKAKKTAKIGLFCIVMAMTCIVGAITAFAYTPPQKHTLSDFSEGGERIFSVSDGTESIEQLAFDYFFTDMEGHVVPLDNLPQKISCIHEYIEGETTEHNRSSNGGCTVIVKSAKACKYCGYIIEGGIISEAIYTVCPH